jgi:hypothetical protein
MYDKYVDNQFKEDKPIEPSFKQGLKNDLVVTIIALLLWGWLLSLY